MTESLKVFSVDEASGLIPALSEKVLNLQTLRRSIVQKETEIDALEMISSVDEKGLPSALDGELKVYQGLINRFYAVIEEIHAMGCFLKDIDCGLVDVYGHHDGRIVHYCWKLGEKEIKFWHEVGKGFSHRQPLQVKQEENEA